jgi:hypothetical protein
MMGCREDYYARVVPVLGAGLRGHVIAARDLSLTGRVIELLLSCMLDEVVIDGDEPVGWPLPVTCRGLDGDGATSALDLLRRYAEWKNAFSPVRWVTGGQGEAELHLRARRLAPGAPPHVVWDEAARTVTMGLADGDLFSHQNVSYAVARQVRDLLLVRSPWPARVTYHGDARWPFAETATPVSPPSTEPLESLRDRHLLVVGCGSVGSEAVRLLACAGSGLRWTLVDGGVVSVFNPQRQWFGCSEIGGAKVEALAARLSPAPVRAVQRELGAASVDDLQRLLEEDRPDLALLTTGTHDHGALAEVLWRAGVPHLAACAYPRARFYEVSVVLPAEATACLCCFRGHLYRGRESAPAVPDELARFLYRDISPAERERLYVDLVAEPATRVETARVGDVLAQCAVEALAAPCDRGPWFARLLAEGTTCLLGGNVVERDAEGTLAYGLSYPGQVVRLGLEDVVGVEEERRCEVCGRRLRSAHRLELPLVSDDEIDLALAG